MTPPQEIKLVLSLPVDLTGYTHASDEVLEIQSHEGVLWLAFLARARGGNVQTVALTRPAAVKLRDDLAAFIARTVA